MTQLNPDDEPNAASAPAWWDTDKSQETTPHAHEAATPGYGERVLATLAHLCSVLNFFVPVLGALFALWVIHEQSRESPFVRTHTEEAMAFQIIYAVSVVSLAAILVGQFYCVPLVPFLIVGGLYCNLVGARKAWHGQPYHYPLTSELLGRWKTSGAIAE